MPWCPQCRTEYDKGAARCSDCDVALVEKLPPLEDHPPVPIYHASTADEARIIIATLRAEGINAHTMPPGYVIPQEDNVVDDMDTELEILVPQDQESAARAILNESPITEDELLNAEEEDPNKMGANE
jgi:hypothetical protein